MAVCDPKSSVNSQKNERQIVRRHLKIGNERIPEGLASMSVPIGLSVCGSI
jgi:hypothetical protein